MTDALFEITGDAFTPTSLARGPWSPDALHGGPPSALLARSIERFEADEPVHVARVTVELLKPVPLAPLVVETRLARPGRKVQLVEATLLHEGRAVARATGLRIRRGDVELPPDRPDVVAAVPGPDEGIPRGTLSRSFHEGFHTLAVEHRFVRGSFQDPGPAIDWMRLTAPLLAGEDTSPLCRVCALADFGNGISAVLRSTHTYVNPDLTVYLHRYPQGEWVCLDAVTRVEPHGVGMAESLLRDERGPIGRSIQSLLIEARPAPSPS
jgi:hypothetical protein